MTELTEFRAAVRHLLSSARSRPPEFPLRPLLYVSGAAATAAGVYYYIKKKEEKEKRVEDPVQTMSLLDPGWMSDEATHSESVVPEASQRETEERNQKVDVFKSPQSNERLNLEKQMKELEELLCEAQRECERKTRDYEALREAHSTLKSQYNQMKEISTHNEEIPKNIQMTLARADEMYEQMMKSNAQLENEKLDLMSQVETLQGSLRKLEENLSESCRTRNETVRKLVIGKGILTFVKNKAALQEKILNQRAESLQVSLDEVQRKYFEAMQTIRNQEQLHHDLESELNEQQEIIHDCEEELSQIKTSCSTATSEMERLSRHLTDQVSKWNLINETILTSYGELSEDHLKLFRQYNELKEEHEKLQEFQVTRVEAAAAFQQVMESSVQQEKEKSELMFHLHKLRGRVQQLEELLYEADRTCHVLKQDRERAEEAHGILTARYRETLKQRNELLKVSLAEAEKKLVSVMESSAQRSSLNLLRSSVQKLENEVSETRGRCEEIPTAQERCKTCEELHLLKAQYNEITEVLRQCDEFLQNYGSDLLEPVLL